MSRARKINDNKIDPRKRRTLRVSESVSAGGSEKELVGRQEMGRKSGGKKCIEE